MHPDGPPPSGNWDDAVGPFLRLEGVRVQLGNVSEAAVLDAVSRDELLALPAETLIFPRFQFDGRLAGLPHLPAVLSILRTAFDSPWTQALWLNSPVPSWGRVTPAQELAAGHHERVLTHARSDAERRKS